MVYILVYILTSQVLQITASSEISDTTVVMTTFYVVEDDTTIVGVVWSIAEDDAIDGQLPQQSNYEVEEVEYY